MKLKGRTALVMGASGGIGRAIAPALAEEEADVAVNYVLDESLAQCGSIFHKNPQSHKESAMMRLPVRFLPLVAVFALVLYGTSAPAGQQQPSQGQKLAHAAEHMDMDLVGFNDLQARSAYQPTIHRQGNRYIAYIGHHVGSAFNPLTGQTELNGTSIVDVTSPANPVYLAHIPVANGLNGGAQMVRVCDGSTLPIGDNKVYMLRAFANSAHQIYDVTDPSHPQFVVNVITGLTGTHKSWWECDTGIAYLVANGPAGWKSGNITRIYDLGHPAAPVFKRFWALDGHQPGGTVPPPLTSMPGLHGPISIGPSPGNRVYFAYGTNSNGVMQIVDREKLLTGDPNDFKTPEIGRLVMSPNWGGHTSFPVLGMTIPDWQVNTMGQVRDFVVLITEGFEFMCQGFRHPVFMVDVSTESRPQSVANFQVPNSSGDFCDRGGSFGPHATNEYFGPPFYRKIVFISWFNAGVRAVDIRDPYNPQEVAFYIPATTSNTDQRCGTQNGVYVCKVAIQTNNVEVDDRGLIYIVDRANTGLHIVELSGDAKKIIE